MKKWILLTIVAITLSFSKDRIEGVASYYAKRFEGRKTATGERYHGDSLTAASNIFPLHTVVEVTDKQTNSSVIVRINDRIGNKHRIIDLSRAAAKQLGIINKGLTTVIIKKL